MTQPIEKPTLAHKTSIADLVYEHEGIKLPLLEMTDPYYPHSKLAKSIFHGYYILFFMYSVIFMITYPLLNFLEGKDLFGLTVIKLVQTNVIWDMISVALFLFMALVFTQISQMVTLVPYKILMLITFVTFVTSGIFITKTFKMYFTDRIFIVVLNWALCVKTLTYIYDKHKLKQFREQTLQWGKMQKQKQLNRIEKRILYLISPIPVYHKFAKQHTPTLKIHPRYLITKLFVSGLCLLVNNILIVKFIEPACRQTNLSFVALIFKLVPLTFYINMILYYMVMDNIIAALNEVTKIQDRVLYLDWWNAQTVHQFLDRWCLIINMVTQQFLPDIDTRIKHTIHGIVLQILLLEVFGQSLSLLACIGFLFVLAVIYFLGGIKQIQNNMIVHVLCMSFTPIMIALEVKYSIFSQGIFD